MVEKMSKLKNSNFLFLFFNKSQLKIIFNVKKELNISFFCYMLFFKNFGFLISKINKNVKSLLSSINFKKHIG